MMAFFCCSVIVSVSQTVARAEPPSDRRRQARNARAAAAAAAAAAAVRGALTEKRSDFGNLKFLFCLRIVTLWNFSTKPRADAFGRLIQVSHVWRLYLFIYFSAMRRDM